MCLGSGAHHTSSYDGRVSKQIDGLPQPLLLSPALKVFLAERSWTVYDLAFQWSPWRPSQARGRLQTTPFSDLWGPTLYKASHTEETNTDG